MQVGVSNGLAGCLSNIDAEIVAVRHSVRFDVAPNHRHKSPDSSLFFLRECKEIRLMPAWNNETVFLIQRKGIVKRHREVIRRDEISASDAVTEDAIQASSSRIQSTFKRVERLVTDPVTALPYTEGHPERPAPAASPATCPDRQGAIAQSRAVVVTTSDNEWSRRGNRRLGVFEPEEMPMSEPARLILSVPYFITRVVPALYHVILLPADRGESDLSAFARAQTHANRLDGCVVLAEHRAIYIHANGRTTASDTPPTGGAIVAGHLAPAIEFVESDELRVRREQLDALVEAFRLRGGVLVGDLTKGGRAATADELRRLEGVNEMAFLSGSHDACAAVSGGEPAWIRVSSSAARSCRCTVAARITTAARDVANTCIVDA